MWIEGSKKIVITYRIKEIFLTCDEYHGRVEVLFILVLIEKDGWYSLLKKIIWRNRGLKLKGGIEREMGLDESKSPIPTLSPSSSCGDFTTLLNTKLFVHKELIVDRLEDKDLVIYINMNFFLFRFLIWVYCIDTWVIFT